MRKPENSSFVRIPKFWIEATITNDIPGVGTWKDGGNTHNESLSTTNQVGSGVTMFGVKLVAEFAQVGILSNAIVAEDYDELAWYCYTDSGSFSVPTWDFGDILPGNSVTKTLKFQATGTGLPKGDERRMALEASKAGQLDLFFNRTKSLKLSDATTGYLRRDDGTAYPYGTETYSSNVSVFCNIPEPGEWVMLAGLGAMGLATCWIRRKRP